jgi:peroxiredoxin
MTQLRRDYKKFQAQDTEIVVVGPERAGAFNAYFEAEKLPFVGLPDPKHTVLKRYGQKVDLFKLGRMPAQVIVDKSGVARFVHYGNSMSDIPSNQAILALLKQLNGENAHDHSSGRFPHLA